MPLNLPDILNSDGTVPTSRNKATAFKALKPGYFIERSSQASDLFDWGTKRQTTMLLSSDYVRAKENIANLLNNLHTLNVLTETRCIVKTFRANNRELVSICLPYIEWLTAAPMVQQGYVTSDRIAIVIFEDYANQMLMVENIKGKKSSFNAQSFKEAVLKEATKVFHAEGLKPNSSMLGLWIIFKFLKLDKFSDAYYAQLAATGLSFELCIGILMAGNFEKTDCIALKGMPESYIRPVVQAGF